MKDENIIIICGFLDLFSVSSFITTLPSHIKSYNVSTTSIGLFFSLYGALQIISSYLMGYIADKSNKKYVLFMCAILSAIGYIVLGMASSFVSMFFLRVITGLFKQTQTLSRTILTTRNVSNDARVTMLGRFSTFSSIGFIFGPPIGGYIHEHYGFFYVGCLSCAGFTVMSILFLTLDCDTVDTYKSSKTKTVESKSITATDTSTRHRNKSDDVKTESIFPVVQDDTLSLVIKTWDIITSIFLLSFCPLIFRTNYSITLKELFQSSGTSSGFATSFGAVTGSVAGILVPYVIAFYRRYYQTENVKVKKFTSVSTEAETMLLIHTSLILGFSILGCGLAPTLLIFVLSQSPVSFVNNLSREGFNVIIANRVQKNQVGRIMGMNGSLIAFGRLVAPVIGGIMQEFSYRMPAYFGSFSSFVAAGIIYKYFRNDYQQSHIN